MMWQTLKIGILVWSCWLILGCQGKRVSVDTPPASQTTAPVVTISTVTPFPAGVVAIVNEQVITQAEFDKRIQVLIQQGEVAAPPDEATLVLLRKAALEELIKSALLVQKARAQQITVTDVELQQRIQQIQAEYQGEDIRTIVQAQGKSYEEWEQAQRAALLLEKLIDTQMGDAIAVTAEEIRQYYDEHLTHYDRPAQLRASQILTYDRAIAEHALQAIRNGADFTEIARTYSESADAAGGGDLGFFAPGVMPPEFDAALLALKMGAVSDVIRTSYGYQIFKLTGQREAHRVRFAEAQAQITTMLKRHKRMAAADLWMAELQQNAKILLNHDVIQPVK